MICPPLNVCFYQIWVLPKIVLVRKTFLIWDLTLLLFERKHSCLTKLTLLLNYASIFMDIFTFVPLLIFVCVNILAEFLFVF